MSNPSPSSPPRETSMTQEEEIEQLASQMDWGDDARVQSGEDEVDREGQGAFVAGLWLDPIDPHPILPRQRFSLSDFHRDYVPSPAWVRTYNRAFIVHFQKRRIIT